MEDVLAKMDPDKKERLINSALKEFGTRDFSRASTNVIVKEAGISKGLLYHYFESKEALYDYVLKFVFTKTLREMLDNINLEEPDLFERLLQISRHKMKLLAKYPAIVDFTKNVYLQKTYDEMVVYMNDIAPGFIEKVYSNNVDYTLFKEGVDVKKAINIMQWVTEKLSESYAATIYKKENKDIKPLFEEFEQYVFMIKQAFYK